MSYATFLEKNDSLIPVEDAKEESCYPDLDYIISKRIWFLQEREEQWLLEHDNQYANGLGRSHEETPFTLAIHELDYIRYQYFEEPYIDNSEQ